MKKIVLFLLFIIVLLGSVLRLYHISTNPPGLYIDEVSIGVNAYDILKTGKDQYGTSYPLMFRAFGEYKMPVYIYLVTASMAIFGKNEFALRLPSSIAGILTILAVFLLCRELLKSHPLTQKYSDWGALIGAFIIAVSPWHLHFSRAGFEATVALFFYSLSILVFLYFLRTKKFFWVFISSVFFALTFYAYDGYRLLVPLTILGGFIASFKNKNSRKWTIIAVILFCILAIPLVVFTILGGGLVRLAQTSAFYPPLYTNPWQNFLSDMVVFTKNYLSYFSITYLFRFGDQINRHQIQDFGLLYLWQLPFLLLGLYMIVKTANRKLKFLIIFLLLSMPLTPGLTKPSPHTLRFLYAVLPFTILTTLGFYQLFTLKTKWTKAIVLLTVLFIGLEFIFYLHYYYIHYPKQALIDWGASCKEVAQKALVESQKGENIIIDKSVPCIGEYFTFYSPNLNLVSGPNENTIIITSPNNKNKDKKPGVLLYTVYLPNLNHDIFAQFWRL